MKGKIDTLKSNINSVHVKKSVDEIGQPLKI